MKTTLTLLAATTALGALISIPAIGATRTPDADASRGAVSTSADTGQDRMIVLASGDDDDDEHRGGSPSGDDDDDDDCDDDDDDDGGCRAGVNPAPAGTVAPPANGLFGNGVAPQGSGELTRLPPSITPPPRTGGGVDASAGPRTRPKKLTAS